MNDVTKQRYIYKHRNDFVFHKLTEL